MIGHKRVPSREGGVEIVVGELSSRLDKKGVSVDIYNRKGNKLYNKEYKSSVAEFLNNNKNTRIFTIPTFNNGKLNAIVYSFLATVKAIFSKYDVIHFHAEGPCAMLWLPKFFKIKTVATIHGLDWQRAKWGGFATKFLKFGEKMAAKYADEIIVLSKNVQQYFRDTYNRETIFIPNGITQPEIKKANLIKENFGLEKDEYILFLARIVPEKGLHYLIEAYNHLKTEKKLVIAGSSSNTDTYFEKIKNMVNKNNKIIMTGFVYGEILEELYSNAYVYVLPSDIEGMPISLLEALSYDNCCLVSDISENTSVVGKNGAVFKKSDVNSLQENLELLLKNEELVRNYKIDAGKYVCDNFSWDKVVNETLDVYKMVKGQKE
ncbi:MAG: glycosyltransferase family 4 protein [Oscillospiraceae bacterium]